MLKSFDTPNKKYKLIPENYKIPSTSNTLTVIVGKNGTGKSRLLRSIVLDFLSDQQIPINLDREDKLSLSKDNLGLSRYSKLPDRIICVSTSPFDKFPLLRENNEFIPYSYLGLKGLPSNNLSMNYMSKIIAELIKSIINNENSIQEIIRILKYLGYKGRISCTFSTYTANLTRKRILEDQEIRNLKLDFGKSKVTRVNFLTNSVYLANEDYYEFPPSITKEQKNIVTNYLNKSSKSNQKPRIDLNIDEHGLFFHGDAHPEEALALISSGYAKLRSLKLEKDNSGIINISDASSGEQSVVMSLLGIASKITNNSLICIDEPEICLHPEWQERYIHLLLDIFKRYNKCQFIIATHSPQIIAELSDKNCFVMKMEDGEAICSEEFSNKSIDFQLVNVFKTPGRRNEYLNRISISLFSRVAKNKNFSPSDIKDMEILNSIFNELNNDDPLKELISALQLIWKKYGSNK